MSHDLRHQHCSFDQLRRALADDLNEAEESGITAHLSECDGCRRDLESLAADAGTWTRAAAWSSDPEIGRQQPAVPEASAGNHNDDDAFDVDFAVQFLDPCDSPGSIGRIGEIEIREIIGRGAIGVVLKGWQPELNRFVAVKVLSPFLAVSGAARRRFEREAQAAAAILHPNVMPIHSVRSTARLPCLVMPFLDCESLQQRLDHDGALPLTELLQIAVQVARGLAAAHAQGLVHRDVKPANILPECGVDRVMLTDFGLARAVDDASLTRSGMIAGTPPYMSPEQACGDAVDQRSDLFSFGSVLYAMAAGRPPFRGESSYAILRKLCESTPRPLQEIDARIPEWLATLIGRLHAPDRSERIPSAAVVAELLEQCLAHVRQPQACRLPAGCRTPAPKRSRPPAHRNQMFAAGLAMAAITTAAYGIWQWQADHDRTPEFHTPDPSRYRGSESDRPVPVSEAAWDDDVDAELDNITMRIHVLDTELSSE